MKLEKLDTCINVYKEVFTEGNSSLFIQKLEKEIESDWSELEWDNSGVGSGQVTQVRTSLGCSLITLFKPYQNSRSCFRLHL
jgi:hypothetical protein